MQTMIGALPHRSRTARATGSRLSALEVTTTGRRVASCRLGLVSKPSAMRMGDSRSLADPARAPLACAALNPRWLSQPA